MAARRPLVRQGGRARQLASGDHIDNSCLNVTSSAIDTTTGRLLKVGDFGSGALALSVTGLLTDLNSVDIPSGIYAYAAGTPGAPDGANGVIEVQRFSAAASRQIARTVHGGAVAHVVAERQVRVGPVFDPWVYQFHSGNQLAIGATRDSAQAAIGLVDAFTSIPMLNSWAAAGSGLANDFRVSAGCIDVRFNATIGTRTAGTVVALMPVGARVSQITLAASICDQRTSAYLEFQPNGAVVIPLIPAGPVRMHFTGRIPL